MRCGSMLVNKGDSQAKVLQYCGEPVDTTSRYVIRPGTYPPKSNVVINGKEVSGGERYVPFGRSEVLLEEWTYNFGPNKLMRRVRFINGVVEDVRTLDYGYREDN